MLQCSSLTGLIVPFFPSLSVASTMRSVFLLIFSVIVTYTKLPRQSSLGWLMFCCFMISATTCSRSPQELMMPAKSGLNLPCVFFLVGLLSTSASGKESSLPARWAFVLWRSGGDVNVRRIPKVGANLKLGAKTWNVRISRWNLSNFISHVTSESRSVRREAPSSRLSGGISK